MGTGRYFFHRVTHRLKIIYAYETAEGYEGNPMWTEWRRPEYIPLASMPVPSPVSIQMKLPEPKPAPPIPAPEPEPAAARKIWHRSHDGPEIPEPEEWREEYIPTTRRERRTLLMMSESTIQRNMVDIVDQRFTRWLRENYPVDSYAA